VKMKIPLDKAFDGDCRLAVLLDAADLDRFATIGTRHRLIAGYNGCAAGTPKTETALGNTLNCGLRSHYSLPLDCWPV
jgi:hypothetical protein